MDRSTRLPLPLKMQVVVFINKAYLKWLKFIPLCCYAWTFWADLTTTLSIWDDLFSNIHFLSIWKCSVLKQFYYQKVFQRDEALSFTSRYPAFLTTTQWFLMISKQLWNFHHLTISLTQGGRLLSKITGRTFLCCSKTSIEAIRLPIILLSSLYHSSSPQLTFYLLKLMFFRSLLEFLAFK